MRSKPLPGRPLASLFDPTARDLPRQSLGPEQRQPPSPYDRTLIPATIQWMRSLPQSVRPMETAANYPRILNRMARFWETPPMIESIFDELLVDRRRGRQGFPARIQAELRHLYGHYRTQHQTGGMVAAAAEARRAPSLYDRTLNAAAVKWLGKLPPAIAPRHAAARFPRLINRIARFWNEPAMVAEIFDDLLVQRRPGRQGFPPAILAEFRALQTFWQGMRLDDPGDIWDSVPDRGRKGSF